MFPELNNLLNTTPDRVEQVISRAAGSQERGGGTRCGMKCTRDCGEDVTSIGMTVAGSCSPGREDPGSGLDTRTCGCFQMFQMFLELLTSSRRPCVPLKVPRNHAQSVGGLPFTNVYPGALCVLTVVGVPAPREGCLRGEESLVFHPSQRIIFLNVLSLPPAPEHSAGRSERQCSSGSSFSWCLTALFQAAVSQRCVVPSSSLAPLYFLHSSCRTRGHLAILHILAQGLPPPGTCLVYFITFVFLMK